MTIYDYYELESSEIFHIGPNEDKSVELSLKRVKVYDTFLGGRVFDGYNPVSNATVKVINISSGVSFCTKTSNCGWYKLKGKLEPGKYKVFSSAEGYITADFKTVILESGKVSSAYFSLKRNPVCRKSTLYGFIRDSISNDGIANAIICLFNRYRDKQYVTYSNSHGQYLIYGIDAGRYSISVYNDNYKSYRLDNLEIPKNDILKLEFTLVKDYNSILGNIEAIIKSSLKNNIPAFLYDGDIEKDGTIKKIQMTNKDGVCLFGDIEPGNYVVKAKLQGHFKNEKGKK